MATSLQSMTVVGVPSLEGRVTSYQRWSTSRFVMPCLKRGKFTLSLPMALGGFSQKFGYPQFFRCDFDFKIPCPNHHIPCIQVTFKTGSRKFVRVPRVNFQGGEDTVSDSNGVQIPDISQPPRGLISDAPSGADFTEVTVNDISPAFSTPSGLYANSNEVAPTASFPSAMGFFEITDAAGATVTSQTTLPSDSSFQTTSTDVQETFSIPGATITGDPTPQVSIDSSLSPITSAILTSGGSQDSTASTAAVGVFANLMSANIVALSISSSGAGNTATSMQSSAGTKLTVELLPILLILYWHT
ncbi:hypothetical protein DID88_003958 [Monilinia fructigena]|uniref:Uncharacterized protein n=1 Tax=Monilinia fructigena TaxID=38457 RepID=A0A395IGQ9_9HELO|nr:hypothetical protein DID88_003958 [Monilinia fructigena]